MELPDSWLPDCNSSFDNLTLTNVGTYLDMNISVEEFKITLDDLKINKAPEPDKLSTEFYTFLPENRIEYLTKLFNKLWNNYKLPNNWLELEMKMIYKKGNKLDPKNYRCITLTNAILFSRKRYPQDFFIG